MINPLERLKTWAAGIIQRESTPSTGVRNFFWGKTPAGVFIDQDTALTLGAVNACVRVIAETLGLLPWHVVDQDPETRRRKRVNGPIDRLLSIAPNPEMTSQTFRETVAHHALLRGNGYAEIARDAAGRPAELWPLPPTGIPRRLSTGELVFEFFVGSERFVLRYADVFHIKGLSPLGIVGYDTISYMATSVGHGIAIEEYASEYFANGAIFSTLLKHPRALSAKAQERLIADMEKTYTGRGNRHRFKVLEEGMDAMHLSATPEQAQMIQAKKLSVEDVARWFRVPLHKIGSLEKATLNNVEQLGIEFVQDTMLPWVVRFETEALIKLIPLAQQGRIHTKMKVSALARGDLKSRMDAYRVGRQWGFLTPNQIAEMEDDDPIPAEMGGDTLIIPINMQDARAMVHEGELKLERTSLDPPAGGQQMSLGLDGGGDGSQTSALRMPRSMASACTRIMDRETRYLGRAVSNSKDLAEAMRNQAKFAHGELYPVVRDMAEVAEIPIEHVHAALRRVTGRYYFRHLDAWQNASQHGRKPAIGELEAERLQDDLRTELAAGISA